LAASGGALAAVSGSTDASLDDDGAAALTREGLGDNCAGAVAGAARGFAALRVGADDAVAHTRANDVGAGGLPKPFE
jgi:hypothetical protein